MSNDLQDDKPWLQFKGGVVPQPYHAPAAIPVADSSIWKGIMMFLGVMWHIVYHDLKLKNVLTWDREVEAWKKWNPEKDAEFFGERWEANKEFFILSPFLFGGLVFWGFLNYYENSGLREFCVDVSTGWQKLMGLFSQQEKTV